MSEQEEEITHYCNDCDHALVVLYDTRDDFSTPIVCGDCGGTNTRPISEADHAA